MSSDFEFQETPNPAPRYGDIVTWTTKGSGDTAVKWSVSPGGVVKLDPTGDHDQNMYVKAVGLGMATITATLQGTSTSISRVVCVGELFAYDTSGQLYSAPSDTWVVNKSGISNFPEFSAMNEEQVGVVYQSVENRLVLDFTVLQDARGDDLNTPAMFSATSLDKGGGKANNQGLRSGLMTYAYAPDGTLWVINDAGNMRWSAVSSSLPAGFPAKSDMDSHSAALAWAPPGDLPGGSQGAKEVSAGVSVTCFVLNQDQLGARSSTYNTTGFSFTKITT